MSRTTIHAAAIISVGLLGAALIAGPLNPPAGPVASTYKTLSEVEPRTAINSTNTPGDADSVYRINIPGSYYLTGNITGQAGKSGIEIAAGGVTIDLNGFELAGVPGSLDGIVLGLSGMNDIAVLNGTVRSWAQDGIDLSSLAAANCRYDNLRFRSCTGWGIQAGPNSVITHCTAMLNVGGGINTNIECSVSSCTAYANSSAGIVVATGSTVTACAAYGNGGNGISAAPGSTVSDCSANNNTGDGISANNACTISHCAVRSNSGDGIVFSSGCLVVSNTCAFSGLGAADGANIHATGNDNRIEANVCTSADRGVEADLAGNFVSRNTCSGNATNWDLVAGNICLVVNASLAPVISGNSGGVAPGSTDPNANFTY